MASASAAGLALSRSEALKIYTAPLLKFVRFVKVKVKAKAKVKVKAKFKRTKQTK